jgi:serine phosphatase RsbU (regulator of sigma subunit)
VLEVREEDIDRITELFHRILKGEIPQPLALPQDYPQNEVRQVVEYANRFATEYGALADAVSALSRGELNFDGPTGRMHIIQSFKNLHANLRHLTWKTGQIAGGDLTQHVDFMGDFSKSFNSMTQQLQQAFAEIDRQNQNLASANDRMKRDLDAAARVQQTLLPQSLPEVGGVRFAWAYRPCDELAGDSLGILPIGDREIGFYVLDVSGHGVPAALLSVTVTRSLSRNGDESTPRAEGPAPLDISPAKVATMLNALYPMESNGDHYFTLAYGILDTSSYELRFVCAGHPGPILSRPGEPERCLKTRALPVGMMEDAEYQDTRVTLQPGDRLYLYSDGLTEEMNGAEEQFGDERLLSAIAESRVLSLQESVDFLLEQVVAWRGDEHLRDDVSIVGVEVSPVPSEEPIESQG